VILAVAVVAAIGTLGYVMATPEVGEKYTEFYILGVNGKAENYPKELSLGKEGRVILGLVNHEQKSEVYRVEVVIDGGKFKTIDPISLKVEEKWEQEVSFKLDSAGLNKKVEFLLYKEAASVPLSTLHLWVDVK